jgi:hypothetical protein
LTGELIMGWKTPKIEYVNGYKIVELDGPIFKVYDDNGQVGDDFPYHGTEKNADKSCSPDDRNDDLGRI